MLIERVDLGSLLRALSGAELRHAYRKAAKGSPQAARLAAEIDRRARAANDN